jgi:hypothetical protein
VVAGGQVAATETPQDRMETPPAPLLQPGLVAGHEQPTTVQPQRGTHHAVPIPGNGHPHALAEGGIGHPTPRRTGHVESPVRGRLARTVLRGGRGSNAPPLPEPFLARAYHLRYDETARMTIGEEGYFWREEDPPPGLEESA